MSKEPDGVMANGLAHDEGPLLPVSRSHRPVFEHHRAVRRMRQLLKGIVADVKVVLPCQQRKL